MDISLRRDHRPYYIKKAFLKFQEFYVNHFLSPQLEHLGKGFTFMRPWHVELFGAPIEMGDCVNVVASSDKKVRLAIWSEQKEPLPRVFCKISPTLLEKLALLPFLESPKLKSQAQLPLVGKLLLPPLEQVYHRMQFPRMLLGKQSRAA